MRIGMVGLGRMGGNMTQRLLRGGHEVVVWARTRESVQQAANQGAVAADSLEDLVAKLPPPRTVWLMIPSGAPTADTIAQLTKLLEAGDTIVDGGNSRYSDSVQRAADLSKQGIQFVDAGTSGGIWGLDNGYCLMVGASDDAYARLEPILATLAPENGYARVGPPGAGHFVKMVHNGVEYALMQAYGEGLELLNTSEFDLDLSQIANVWRHGSVVRSWLLDLIANALDEDPKLGSVSDYVEDSGEGRWTVETAINNAVPTPAIALALFQRFASRQDESFANKVIAALRKEFGGHAVRPKDR